MHTRKYLTVVRYCNLEWIQNWTLPLHGYQDVSFYQIRDIFANFCHTTPNIIEIDCYYILSKVCKALPQAAYHLYTQII